MFLVGYLGWCFLLALCGWPRVERSIHYAFLFGRPGLHLQGRRLVPQGLEFQNFFTFAFNFFSTLASSVFLI